MSTSATNRLGADQFLADRAPGWATDAAWQIDRALELTR